MATTHTTKECICCQQDSKMLDQPPPMMDPKLQQLDYRPPGGTSRVRQRQRSNRRASSGAGAAASAAAAVPGRVNAVGIPGQYMQPVSVLCYCTQHPSTLTVSSFCG